MICIYRITSRFNVKINEQSSGTQREILRFSDQNPGYDYQVGSQLDPTFGTADTGDDSLQNFFSRPIKIQSYSWGTGTNLFETFNPWQDFWENDRVINRITNFNLLRCKLCVKFVLNGNGFHYGRAIASYIPLHNYDGFTKDRSFFIQDVVESSQRPHIYLDPTNSQGGTMCLPFVWRYNALDVPDQDWRDMGQIIIHGMQNLKHANGASDSVTVSIFAWAEDVVMSTPTANEPGALSPQSGQYMPQADQCDSGIISKPATMIEKTAKVCAKTTQIVTNAIANIARSLGTLSPQSGQYTPQADEYGSGIVSKPAAMIAKAAGALSNAPGIGLYAKATQIGASAIASIAKSFGYSRPNNLSEIQPFRPTYFGNLANTNFPDSATKFTYDAKQELSCDTRTFGLDGTDEMTIKSIATRESFLTNFAWDVASTTETLLWNSQVNPVIWSHVNVGGVDEWHMPACCFATLPFRAWRGTMKFRFQIVASAFHKGRLKITYDPSYPLTNEYNTNYTRVIDIAEERDFTVEIGWGQQQSFLKHRPMLNNTTEIFSATALGIDSGEFANGIISVYVVNELTVPNSTANNDIEVNVFVSAGDDFEVANPDDGDLKNLSWYAPQSGAYIPQAGEGGENVPDSDNTDMENAPMKLEPDETMAAQMTDADHTMDVYYGDPVTSIRQIFKRYCYSRTLTSSTQTGWKVVDYIINNFPLMRGFAPDGVDSVTTPTNPTDYNFCAMTMMNYYTPGFVCWRGGIKWKYQLTTDNLTLNSFMLAERVGDPEFSYGFGDTTIPPDNASPSTRIGFWANNLPGGLAGTQVTAAGHNPCLEVEVPFFTNSRFLFGKQDTLNTNLGVDSFFHRLMWKENTSATTHNCVHSYVAAGEDFTLGFFTGAPVAYYQVNPTAA
jgi:hypothetical protein